MVTYALLPVTLLVLAFQASGSDRLLVYPSIPGTSTPNYLETPYVVEDNQIYQAIPGTRTPDRTGESWSISDDEIYPNIPGTRTPNRLRGVE